MDQGRRLLPFISDRLITYLSGGRGITFNPGGVLDMTFNDKSSSTTSIKISGTHTKAISTDTSAGPIEFGNVVNLSTAPLTAPSFLDNSGSRTNAQWYGGLPGQRWQLALGTVAAPITKPGSAFSISQYSKVILTDCGGTYPWNAGQASNTGCVSR